MNHHTVLIDLIRTVVGEPKIGCEVGVCQGDLSLNLLKAFPILHLLMIDHFRKYEHVFVPRLGTWTQERMYQAMQFCVDRTMFANDRRTVMIGDSASSSRVIEEGSLDFVFIDAGHDYDSIKADLNCFCSKVRDGGLISGHDYRGMTKAPGHFGVKLAVNEFVRDNPYELEVCPKRVWRLIKL